MRFQAKSASVRHMCACGHMDHSHEVLPSLERPPIEAIRIPVITQRQLLHILTRQRVAVPYTLSINDSIEIVGHPNCLKKRILKKRSCPFQSQTKTSRKSSKGQADKTDPQMNHPEDLSSLAWKESLYVARKAPSKTDGTRENARPPTHITSIEMMNLEVFLWVCPYA